jgi:hypothetical protein
MGPFFPFFSHTNTTPTHNTLSDMNYIHAPNNLVLGMLVSSWSGGSMTLGVFLWDGWMDGWIPSFTFSRVLTFLGERTLVKKKVSC